MIHLRRVLRVVCLATELFFGVDVRAQTAADAKPAAVAADRCADKAEPRGFHILLENDLFSEKLGLGHSDRWYTNGIKFMLALRQECLPFLSSGRVREFITGETESDPLTDPERTRKQDSQIGFTVGQLIFTPQDIRDPAPQPFDRFWGGWLYAGAIIQRQPEMMEEDKNNALETLEIDVGVVGPPSLAHQAQDLVHKTIDVPLPQGWGNQLRSEIGIQATYSQSQRLTPKLRQDMFGLDFATHYGFALGTLFDYANAGVTARIGYGLDSAPLGTIESPSLGGFAERGNRFYVLARADAKRVFHNTFIDGSLFRAPPHASFVVSNPFVYQATLGAVVEFRNVILRRFAFMLNRRSAEFNVPSGDAPGQTFATVQFEFAF